MRCGPKLYAADAIVFQTLGMLTAAYQTGIFGANDLETVTGWLGEALESVDAVLTYCEKPRNTVEALAAVFFSGNTLDHPPRHENGAIR
jgi:hypothetical protein